MHIALPACWAIVKLLAYILTHIICIYTYIDFAHSRTETKHFKSKMLRFRCRLGVIAIAAFCCIALCASNIMGFACGLVCMWLFHQPSLTCTGYSDAQCNSIHIFLYIYMYTTIFFLNIILPLLPSLCLAISMRKGCQTRLDTGNQPLVSVCD